MAAVYAHAVFRQGFLCVTLRSSASSAWKCRLNAEGAEIRREDINDCYQTDKNI